MIGFTRSLAREVGRDGITVNAVTPGAIRTDAELEMFPDQNGIAHWLSEEQSVPRRGLPEDIAAAVEREKPQALFMDVHLGEQSGMKVLEAIRRNRDTANVRVIMTSGLNVKEECMRYGADVFLLKPFMPDDLISALKDF